MIYLILLVGLILRLISLNQSLWLDEATTALVAKMPLSNIFNNFLPNDVHPPLYYLIVKYWSFVFGTSEVALRIPSVLFGLGTIYFTYLIGKKIFNEKTGLLAAAFLATSGLAVYYSQEARMYSLAALLVSLSIWLFINKKWIIFSIILMLIGLSDYVALFILPVFLIVGWKDWKKIIPGFIPLLGGFAVWSPIFIKQIVAGLSVKNSSWLDVMGAPTLKNLALIPIKFMFGRIGFDNKYVYACLIILAGGVFAYFLYKSIKSSKLLWAWLVIPIVLGVVVSIRIPNLSYFRFLYCLTPFYLLTAYGIEKLGKKAKIFIVFIITFNVMTSGYYLFNSKFQREDWRDAVSFIEIQKTKNSITVFPSNSNEEAYLYYAPDAKITGPDGIRGGYSQIWLMDYLSSVFDPTGTAKSKVEALGYKEKASYAFNGVGEVHLYENSH